MMNKTRPAKRPAATLGTWSKIVLPAVVILAVAAVGAAIKGWPPLPFLAADGPKHDPNDWCAGHGVPESKCTLCNKQLAAAMCSEHQVPESLCMLCNAELAEQIPTCAKHGLPPSFCPSCKNSAVSWPPSGARTGWNAPNILLPKGPKSAELCRLDLPMVKLASPKTAGNAGIETVRVQSRSLAREITCNGRVTYQENLLARVRPRLAGIVRKVHADVGRKVGRGDVLATVDSLQLGEAKADYFSALALLELSQKNFDRLKDLARRQVVPGKSLIEIETRLSETRINASQARQRLLNFGISRSDIDGFAEREDTSSLLPIAAPLDGVIVRRHAVPGEAVETTTELFAVADLTAMWVHLDLYENDLRWVRQRQDVTFIVESLPESRFPGKVTWINPQVNARTRTIEVRAEVANVGGQLRAGMYGTGVIRIDAPREALVVPKPAVQWHQRSPVVFVKRTASLFEPRRVSIGRKAGPFWEVLAGLKPDELVVTTGSFLLKTELMKGSIGAGCCGD